MASVPSGNPSGSPDELPIDVELIKVLASDTRRDILRLLGERRRTLTELADAIGLKKATVLEHLGKLVEADLIKRLDQDERLWVYYELTPRGKRLVRPERTRFFLILGGTAAAALILGAIVAAAMFGGFGGQRAGEDNMASAPEATQTFDDLDAVDSPTTLWRGLDESAQIRVPNAPADTVLRLVGPDGSASTFTIAEGVATLDARAIDALPAGEHRLYLASPVGEMDLARVVTVNEPDLAVFPLALPEGATSSVEIMLGAPSAGAPASAEISIGGNVTQASGQPLRVDVTPEAGTTLLQVGRLTSVELVSIPQFAVQFTRESDAMQLQVTDADAPLADARVLLDGVLLGTTDANGTLASDPILAGEHALRISAGDGRTHERGIVVGSDGTLAELAPAIRIAAFDARIGGSASGLRVRADVFNDGPAAVLVTLAAREGGALLASDLVSVPAHGRAEALLEAPLARPNVVDVTAHAARASATVLYARGESTSADAGAPAPAAPAMTPTGAKDAYTYRLADQADARATLFFGSPTTSAAEGMQYPTPTPRVPGLAPVLAIAIVALAALALRRPKA